MSTMSDSTRVGLIDCSLDLIVTRFQLSEKAVESLPAWLQAKIPKPSYSFSASHNIRPDREDGVPIYFIGKQSTPVTRVSAPHLPEQFAIHGFVPKFARIYIAKVRQGKVKYGLNIRWRRRSYKEDSECTYDETMQLLQLFHELQYEYAWSLKAMEFAHGSERHIVLDFRDKQPIPPSRRLGKIVVETNRIRVL